jgi:hypothetical protein
VALVRRSGLQGHRSLRLCRNAAGSAGSGPTDRRSDWEAQKGVLGEVTPSGFVLERTMPLFAKDVLTDTKGGHLRSDAEPTLLVSHIAAIAHEAIRELRRRQNDYSLMSME